MSDLVVAFVAANISITAIIQILKKYNLLAFSKYPLCNNLLRIAAITLPNGEAFPMHID
jgi:undecaprenyl pyrophosphate phosphatase UppP